MGRKKKFLSLLVCIASAALVSACYTACKPSNDGDVIITTPAETLKFAVEAKQLSIYSRFQLQVNQTEGVSFESSDENIATVDENGLVHAKNFGVATITAKKGDLRAYCTITVVGENIVPTIQIVQEEIVLLWSSAQQSGTTFDIRPQIFFDGTLYDDGVFTFESNMPAVATVDENGVITATGYGNAVITVKGNWRGNFGADVLSKTLNVSVIPNADIQLTAERTRLGTVNAEVNGNTYRTETTLTASVLLDGETYDTQVMYEISPDGIVSIEGNVITALQVGSANIVAKCTVEGIEITSMPLVIEVVAPTVSLSDERTLYNVKRNMAYNLDELEGEILSVAINGVACDEYVDEDGAALDLSAIYQNFLGDSLIEITTSKYNYRHEVKFVTHIITNGDELRTCLKSDKEKDAIIYAVLANDISFSAGTFTASSTGFTGVFDGQGYTIDARGTKIAGVYGLFGRLKAGELKNFALINVIVYGKESTILGERTYEGGSVSNLYVQAKYEENTEKDYSKDKEGTLYYCGLFRRGFVFENVIVNVEYPVDMTGYALCGDSNEILVKNSYSCGNALQMAKTDAGKCYMTLSALLEENLGRLTKTNGFADFWDFDEKSIRFGNLLIEDVVVKDRIESTEDIVMDLSRLVSGEITAVYIDGVSVDIPQNNQLTLVLADYTANVEHSVRVYTAGEIVEQPFMFNVEVILETPPEADLIVSFYKQNGSEKLVHTLKAIGDFMSKGNVAYGIENIDGNNSSTMYIELSYAELRELFTDSAVTAISFDVILSVQKKLQINTQDLFGPVFFSGVESDIDGQTCYIHTLTITRAYFEALTNTNNLKLRYTYDKDISGTTIYSGNSSFLYVDNLTVRKDTIAVDEVITNEVIESSTDITLDLATLVEGEITALYVNNRLTAIPQDNRLVIAAKDYAVGTKYTIRICIEGKIVVQPFIFKEAEVEKSPEGKLIASFYKTTDTKQTLTEVEDFMSTGNSAYGIAEIKSNNSSTMYIELSYAELRELFTDSEVTGITFDVILSVQKKLQINGQDLYGPVFYSVEESTVGETTYYIHRLTITRAYFEALTNTNNLKLRYTYDKDVAGNTIYADISKFLYVDNLVARKDVITLVEVITKESIESTTDITLDLATLVEGEITALYVNNRLTAIPQDNRLVIAAKDYTVGTKYTVRICIEGKIVVQPFIFKEAEVEKSPEGKLIASFYKTTDTKQTLTEVEDFMSTGNSAYGIAEIKSNNSSTMYIELSYAELRELFTDSEVTGITFDVILSVQKKLQINGQDLYGPVFYSVEESTVGETTYYIHRLTITRAYFEALTNTNNLKLRYTYDKDVAGDTIYADISKFLYVDNLVARKDVITVDEVITKESIESTTDITLDLATLVEGEITALYVNNRLTAIPQDNQLVIAAKDYTVGTKYTVRICIGGKIVVQPFTFKEVETVKIPTESDLIATFYKTTDTKQTLTEVEDFMSAGNSAYGIAEIKSNNSATMYFTLSSKVLEMMFADETVTAITFDVILSTGAATIQRGKNAENLTIAATSSSGAYYIYAVMITRAHYESYGKTEDMLLRYTGGGNSGFFFVDNLATYTGEIGGGDDVGGSDVDTISETKLIKGFSNTKGGADQTLTTDNVVDGKSGVYGIGQIKSNNSSTMYIALSYEYMSELFAIDGVTAITFDVILSVEKKLQLNAADFPATASYTYTSKTVDGDTYYVYTVVLTKEYYNGLSKDVPLRYTFNGKDAEGNVIFGGTSSFFYVDNLAVVKAEG